MPEFTQIDLENMAAANLKKLLAKGSMAQNVVDMPLLNAMDANKKSVDGVKDHTVYQNVKEMGGVTMTGFNSNEDEVTHTNPGNNRQASFIMKDHYAGIEFSRDEAQRNGFKIVENQSDAKASKEDATRVVHLLNDKNEELIWGVANSKWQMLWDDGSTDPKGMAGIRSLILDDPVGSPGVVGGLDQSVYTFWRNWSWLGAPSGGGNGIPANAGNASEGRLIKALNQDVFPKLRRYRNGRAPNWAIMMGDEVRRQLIEEYYAKGQHTQSGFTADLDVAIGGAKFEKNRFVHDTRLDEIGMSNRMYFIDLNAIKLRPVEDDTVTSPNRPTNKFTFQKGILFYGGLTADQLNTSGVLELNNG